MTGFSGGCFCGKVRYESAVDLPDMVQCHCRDCQYVSGGGPANVLIMSRADITITQGEKNQLSSFTCKSAQNNMVTRMFCSECGTSMFTTLDSSPDLFAVKVGTLDDASKLKVGTILWAGSAQPWAHLDDGIPTFEENPIY